MSTDEIKSMGVYRALEQLRKRGWMVAVHNDYMQHGRLHTFWLFTSTKGQHFIKGESTEDFYALNQVLEQADKIEIFTGGASHKHGEQARATAEEGEQR